jgi:hypothetical protein
MTKKLKNNPTHTFTTYDLGVSTALLCAGFELLSVDKENPKKALFIFRKEEDIEETANSYCRQARCAGSVVLRSPEVSQEPIVFLKRYGFIR